MAYLSNPSRLPYIYIKHIKEIDTIKLSKLLYKRFKILIGLNK